MSYISTPSVRRISQLIIDIDKQWGLKVEPGYITSGYSSLFCTPTEFYNYKTDTWTIKVRNIGCYTYRSAFNLNGYGYTTGGLDASYVYNNTVERYTPDGNIWENVQHLNNTRAYHTAFSIAGRGYVAGGQTTGDNYITNMEKYDATSNTWSTGITVIARSLLSSFILYDRVHLIGGKDDTDYLDTVERYNPYSDTIQSVTGLNTARSRLTAFSMNNYGYAVGGRNSNPYLNTVEQYNYIADIWYNKNNLPDSVSDLSSFNIMGCGYVFGGYTEIGLIGTFLSTTRRYNDASDTWITRANLNLAQSNMSAFHIDTTISDSPFNIVDITKTYYKYVNLDYGYTVGGRDVLNPFSTTERYNDTADAWINRASMTTTRYYLSAFFIDDYIYVSGGYNNIPLNITESFNDFIWKTKANLNTARYILAGFSLNGYGYTAGGSDESNTLATTEQYNNISDTWATKANLNTARYGLAGFSLNGYGYTAGGSDESNTLATTEQYNNISDTWATKANLNTARYGLAGFSLNGYGYTVGGHDESNLFATTEQYNDISDTWTTKANLNTARVVPAAFTLNGYGYTAGGSDGSNTLATTEQYNNISDTWATKANLNTARFGLTGSTIVYSGKTESNRTDSYSLFDQLLMLNTFETGYTTGGDYGGDVLSTTEAYIDTVDILVYKADLSTPRTRISSFVSYGNGYILGGRTTTTGSDTGILESYNPLANTWYTKTSRTHTGGKIACFTLKGYAYTVLDLYNDRYNTISDTWNNVTTSGTRRHSANSFTLNSYGYLFGGQDYYTGSALSSTEQYNDITDTWTYKANMPSTPNHMSAYTLNGYGYSVCSWNSGVNYRYDDASNTWSSRAQGSYLIRPSAFTLNGYGYILNGYYQSEPTSSFNQFILIYIDISDSWSVALPVSMKRALAAGFSLIYKSTSKYMFRNHILDKKLKVLTGTLFTGGGNYLVYLGNRRDNKFSFQSPETYSVTVNDATDIRYNKIVAQLKPKFIVSKLGGDRFLVNVNMGLGFTAGGYTGSYSAVTERYDDIANTWTTRDNLNTARYTLAGFSLNGYGYTAGGDTGSYSAVTERYDDIANTWTTKDNLNTARGRLAGFSLNGYGYTAGGGGISSVTEKYDDIANTWTTKANLNIARQYLAALSFNGYGYTAGGDTGSNSAVTEKYDDIANTWTTKANLNTARSNLAGFSLNGYGYTAGGIGDTDQTEKYDDIANTWTTKANLNTGRYGLAGISLNGHGYTAGGYTTTYSAVTEQYNDTSDTWTTKANLNTARSTLSAFALNEIHISYLAVGISEGG